MSSAESDRNFRASGGNEFPPDGATSFADAVAAALRREYGGTPGAVKRVAKITRANARSVRNWFDATNAPNGEMLMRLLQQSDEVLEAVLVQSGRTDLLHATRVIKARAELDRFRALMDEFGV